MLLEVDDNAEIY